jgi:hypothetical protein
MQRCRDINRRIGVVKDTANDRGLEKAPLNALLRKRDHIRKIAALRDDLEADQRHRFDQMEKALGDFGSTELGKAAIKRNGGDDKRTEQQHALEELTQG